MTIRHQPREQIDPKACDTPGPGLLNVADGLPRSVTRPEPRTLPQEPCVPEAEQTLLPVRADCCPAFKPVSAQAILQSLGERASLRPERPPQAGAEPLARLAVIALAWRQAPGQECACLLAQERAGEAAPPPPRGLASRGQPGQARVGGQAVLGTHGQRRRGPEGPPGAAPGARRQRAAQRPQRRGRSSPQRWSPRSGGQ